MTHHLARTERLALCETFEQVGPDAPTLSGSWATRDLAAHLVIRERRPDLAIGIVLPQLGDRTQRGQDRYAARPWGELVGLVRSGPPVWSPTRVPRIDDVANLVEFVVHHEDVLRGDGTRGPRRELDPQVEDAVWAGLARMGRVLVRRVPAGVRFVAPGREPVVVGDGGVTLTGAPLELLLTAYGRGQVADTEVTGSPEAVAGFDEAKLGL